MKRLNQMRIGAAAISAAVMMAAVSLSAEEQAKPAKPATPKPYPLKVCAVSGEKLVKADTQALTYRGQEVKVCGEDCATVFSAQPGKHLKQVQQRATVTRDSGRREAGWTLAGNDLFAVGDAPSRWDWR